MWVVFRGRILGVPLNATPACPFAPTDGANHERRRRAAARRYTFERERQEAAVSGRVAAKIWGSPSWCLGLFPSSIPFCRMGLFPSWSGTPLRLISAEPALRGPTQPRL